MNLLQAATQAAAQGKKLTPGMTTIPGNTSGVYEQDGYELPSWLYESAGPNAIGQAQAAGSTGGFGGFGGAITNSINTIGGKNLYAARSPFQDMQGYTDNKNIYVRDPSSPGAWLSYDALSPAAKAALQGKYSALNGTNYNVLDANGNVIGQRAFTGLKDQDHVNDVMMAVTGAALGGMAAFGGAAGAGGAAASGAGGAGGVGGVTGLSSGADLSAFYGGLDGGATLGGGGSFSGAGMGSTLGAVPGSSGPSLWDSFKSGASNLFSGGSGSGSGFSWSSLAGPAASLVGGYMNSKAAKDAADAQREAADRAAGLSEPWRVAGQNALTRMQEMLGIGGNSGVSDYGSLSKPFTFTNDDPSYQWRLDQGLKGVKNAYAAKGGFLSGGAMKGINDYAQGAASQEYQSAFNRDQATKTNQFNRLASLSGNGQTAANTIGEYGTQAGNARAAGTVGSANAMNNALTGAWNSYTSNELLNKLLQR